MAFHETSSFGGKGVATKNQFELISFKHVYREWNRLAIRLSKEATEQSQEQYYIEEHIIDSKGAIILGPSTKAEMHNNNEKVV